MNGGHFDDKSELPDRLLDQLKKSKTWMTLVQKELVLTSSNAELYGAIVQASHELTVRKYPRARFVALFWNESGSSLSPLIVSSIRARGVPLILIGDVLDMDDPKYRIHAYDTHPSAAANERIADYLAPRLACIPRCGSDSERPDGRTFIGSLCPTASGPKATGCTALRTSPSAPAGTASGRTIRAP